jgi:hypothetical protein
VFGTGVKELGEGGGLPGYFVAHVLIGVLDTMQNIEGRIEIEAENVVICGEEREDEGVWRCRGWPAVVLVGLVCEAEWGEGGMRKDAKGVLEFMAKAIGEWSDSAAFFDAATKEGEMETDDEMLLVLRDVQEMMKFEEGSVGMEEVRAKVYDRLVDIRQAGPQQLPDELAEMIRSHLVTNEEMRRALREPTVIAFNSKHEAFVRIIADEPVEMGIGGHAGMKTSRILVMRFRSRRQVFSKMCGVHLEG